MIRVFVMLLVCLVRLPVAAAAEPAAVSPDQARAALEVLSDPQKRAAFTATLQAIVKAQGSPIPAPAASAAAPAVPEGPLNPDSLGAQALLKGTAFLDRSVDRAITGLVAIQGLPLLWGWLMVMATNPLGQAVLLEVGWHLLLALAGGLGMAWALHRALRRPSSRLHAMALAWAPAPIAAADRAEAGDVEAPPGSGAGLVFLFQRGWLALGRLGLTWLPPLGLWATGHVVAAVTRGGPPATGLVIAAVLWATALSHGLVQAVHILLAPAEARLRLVPLDDPNANALTRAARNLILVSVCGYAMAEVGLLLGLPDVAHEALLRIVGLLVTIGIARIILRQRQGIQRALRPPAGRVGSPGATGLAAAIRARISAIWHWIALLGLAVLWLAWATNTAVTAAAIGQYAGLTVMVAAVARLALMGLRTAIGHLTLGEDGDPDQPSQPAHRLSLYHPALRAVSGALVYVVALLVLMQIYGAGTLTWLWSTASGQRVISGVLTLALTVLTAIALWELANAAIQRHLTHLLRDAQLARSARLRTLLPVLRTTLLIAISIVTILMVLSQIGVNIAPLLAGAGILGVAIGFGSQKLVQDLITGLFLLLENALQIGDVVNVSGLSGIVEGLSVRTITLRAGDGAIHIIPFSAVTSVTNHSRGVGNAEVRVTVEFDADTDRVADALRAIVAEMREEPDYKSQILQDFMLWGVDRIDAQGVSIAGQVACTDSGRWPVQREINRRIKLRFQDLGIEFFKQPWPAANA